MSNNPVQVFIAAYQSEDGAEAVLKDFRPHKKVMIEETADPSGKTWGKLRAKGSKHDDLKAIGEGLRPEPSVWT